jgi:hypothetical protein
MVAFAAGLALAAALAGCSHAPRSASDCGRHYLGGSGLLGLAGAMGAFDRDAGPDCQVGSGYAVTSGYIPPNEVWMPPDPAPEPAPIPTIPTTASGSSSPRAPARLWRCLSRGANNFPDL